MDLVESVRPRPFSDPYTDDLNLTAKCSTQDLVANLKQLTNIPCPPPDMSERGQAVAMEKARKAVREYFDEVRLLWGNGTLK